MKPYLKYLFEVLAIVVGITLSFMVDEWREDRQARKETIEILKMMKQDLVEDTTQLAWAIRAADFFKNKYRQMLTSADIPASPDSVLYWYDLSSYRYTANLSNSGYESFTNLNSWRIKNYDLLKQISHYYERTTRLNLAENRLLDYTIQSSLEDSKTLTAIEIESFIERVRNGTDSEFSVNYWSKVLVDSTEQNLRLFDNYISDLNLLLGSQEFRVRLSRKQNLEESYKYFAKPKYEDAKSLIRSIEEEIEL